MHVARNPNLFSSFPGPQHSSATYHEMYMCIAPYARRHMWDPTFDFIDRTTCNQVGRKLEKESAQRMQLYPLGNVVFYTQIPYIESHVMSRLFQFMVADLGIQFTSSDYPERLMSKYTQVSFPVCTGPIPSMHRSHSQYTQIPFPVL